VKGTNSDYNDIIDEYGKLSSIDENIVKCLIKPLKDTHIKAIKNNVDSSFEEFNSYIIALDFDDNAIDESGLEHGKRKTAQEILRDIEHNKFIVDEKVKMVSIVFDLVNDAVSRMNELTIETREIKRKDAEIDGCFYIRNESNTSAIMRILYDENLHDYRALVYSNGEVRKYTIFLVGTDEPDEKANIIAFCTENNSVDIYSFDVDISELHSRVFSCRHIRGNRTSAEGFIIKKLDEGFMGFNNKTLLSEYISQSTFRDIDRKAKKEIRVTAEIKAEFPGLFN